MTKPRIAIVEDDADQLHNVEEYLLDAGYEVWGAASAEAFYRQFIVSPTDVVILDIGLPGEDGLAVAKLLQEKPQVATIILSARNSLVDRLSGLRSGADRYLIKPVNLLELAANIDAAAKRLAFNNAPNAPHKEPNTSRWNLATKDWILTSPSGCALHLTTHEYTLLNSLIRAQGKVVSKQDLITQTLGPRAQNGNERLNLLITRLRKKASATFQEPLPLKTAHQLGYGFTATAQLSQEAAA